VFSVSVQLANHPKDSNGKPMSREEAAALLVEQLLDGKSLGLSFFENEDGSIAGSGRIDELEGQPVTPTNSTPTKFNPTKLRNTYTEEEATDDLPY
jgi:hypothetical protein